MKLIGLFLLGLIPTLLGHVASREFKERKKRQEALLSLLEYMRFQIQNFRREQKEIFRSFENPVLKQCGFWDTLLDELDENPCGAWGRTVENNLPLFSFRKEEEELILQSAKSFGLTSGQRQLQELERVIGELNAKSSSARQELEHKAKLWRMAGITAGLGIIILLI